MKQENANSTKLIVSLYDYTGEWAKPYVDAGYPVLLWDKKVEGDIFENWGCLIAAIENAIEAGYYPHGILAAPPCTDFASSGARHFAKKDASTERCGYNELADNTVDLHIMLVDAITLLLDNIEQLTGYKFSFWVFENPVGRLERLMPEMKKYRKMLFNPCDFGDPYTKKTILWGEFNADLTKTPVESTGSKMHLVSGWDKEKQKTIRSATPPGFAKAFFQANQ